MSPVSTLKTKTAKANGRLKYKRNLLGLEIERQVSGGIVSRWEYDEAGRPLSQKVQARAHTTRHQRYQWNVNDRLHGMINELTGGKTTYHHDAFGNLAWAKYEDGAYDYKLPDEVGNLYKTKDRRDRKYGPGGQLLQDDQWRYSYDEEGNLVSKTGKAGTWRYEWQGNGMLKRAISPGRTETEFIYDALGRRTAKIHQGKITRFVWDGNVPLHEWQYDLDNSPEPIVADIGMLRYEKPEPVNTQQLATWVFENGTFIPSAKIEGDRQYSIVCDYLGTPVEAYDEAGERVWKCELDIYGNVRNLEGRRSLIPFRFQGQYEDEETGLYYNRFRYYSPIEGMYMSQDPIGLDSEVYNFYSYVDDTINIIDPLGLIRRKSNGQFAKKPGPKPKPSAHGNSIASTKPAVLYAMYDEDGNFQKWGITQETANPRNRYGNSIPDDWTVEPVDKGSRSSILALERELVETNPGPLNKESWAGNRQGDTNISSRAQKALNTCK